MPCIEAMVMAKPVVATNIPGPSEIVVDNVTGFLVPTHSPEMIAKRTSQLLDNLELMQTMGRLGRKRAEDYFDIKKLTLQIEDIYRQTLKE